MERFFKKISVPPSPVIEKNDDTRGQDSTEFILSNLPSNPGKRIRILDYNPNIRDQVRRAYVLAGPQQPKTHNFPYKKYGDTQRRFNPAWFDDFPTWLEYSVEKDAAFCLCCYLFKPNIGEQAGGDFFVGEDSGCAYYIHCFAHQLQLALVAVAKKNIQIESLFSIVTILVNVVGASSKRCDLLREKQSIAVIEALNSGEFTSGKGKNQETTLKRAGETRWGSHFGTLVSIMTMFSSILDVLEVIADDGVSSQQRCEANNLLDSMQSFNFVFNLHLMKDILGITNELSQALQRKDQDIVNAMKLVGLCKQRLEIMRKSGWDSLLSEVSEFCLKHDIDVPNMDDMFLSRMRGQRKAQAVTNMHHYCVGIFYVVLDWQLQELNNRFNETNTELLLCLACLCPADSFSAFDSQKLLRLAQFYPKDFSMNELVILKIQLETYIMDMRSSIEFSGLKEIGDLAKKMVQCKKHKVYSLVYLLVTLALTLPVATATVERAFSAMKILKNRLRNRMGDQWMNDNMVIFIERDI